ncbi:hypothetical protein LL251_20540 [Sphingobium naphthae]|nr:hypothetical protein [Sphingobium naphthae]
MDLTYIWHDILTNLGRNDILTMRPDFRFDPTFYAHTYNDISSLPDLKNHYDNWGRNEGRHPNSYSATVLSFPTINIYLEKLCNDYRLLQCFKDKIEGAHELLFELIAVGDGIDLNVSDFSSSYYLDRYPDIRDSEIDPFAHFICFGILEGRSSLGDLRKRHLSGGIKYDPAQETCLICVHEMSRTGAPVVGLELARGARKSHNVIVISLKGGILLDDFLEVSTEVIIVSDPKSELKYINSERLNSASFAILNSVESIQFAPSMVERNIKFCSYIHEYTEYTMPTWKSIWTGLFSDLIVFSSGQVRKSWQPIFRDIAFNIDRDSMIIPQAKAKVCGVAQPDYTAARSEISSLIGVDCTNKKIVYGAGHVQFRKGTDLFVISSQISRRSDGNTIYIWIGDGLNHEDLTFGVWLDKQCRELGFNRSDGNIFFLPAGPAYKPLCQAADCLFLSSRLDPLPNVVFDALKYGCDVVMFENATGFSDPFYNGVEKIWSVPYIDVAYATRLMTALRNKVASTDGLLCSENEEYEIFDVIRDRISDVITPVATSLISSEYDVPIMYSKGEKDKEKRKAERDKIWSYERDYVWRNSSEAKDRIKSSDSWYHSKMDIKICEDVSISDNAILPMPSFYIHMHAYYVDGVEEDLEQHAIYRHAHRIVVTTDTAVKRSQLREISERLNIDLDIRVCPNKGRDILPFLNIMREEGQNDDIWCHVHQKQSIGSAASGEVWRKYLTRILLGDEHSVTSAFTEINKQDVGLVTAFDPFIVNWGASYRLFSAVEDRFPTPLPTQPLLFPVGNMFWIKGSVAAEMNKIFPAHFNWSSEPLPNDGSEFHLIERLWPAAAAMAGCQSIFLEKKNILRV